MSIIKFALVAVHVLAVLSSPTESRADDELVQTPAGLVPKSSVHAVPEGAIVHQSPTEVSGPLLKRPSGTTARRALQSGYVAYGCWQNTSPQPIAFFGTNWDVPPTPSSWNGQILYWFNALTPSDLQAILQPVLQYGVSAAGGGEFYGIASWWLIGSETYHSAVQRVSPGTSLQGHMALTGISTSGGVTTYSYSSFFVGYSTPSISMSTTGVLDVACEALEIDNAASTKDLPSGSTDLTAVDIQVE